MIDAPLPTIDSNIPFLSNSGAGTKGKWKTFFDQIKVGDSFILDKAYSYNHIYIVARKYGCKIASRKVNQERRVWIISKTKE